MSQQQFQDRNRRCGRSGFTLVEMIVVIVVVLGVSGLAIGFMAPDNDSRRIRETARQISSMMQSARAKAIETGRPVGVVLEPDAFNAFRVSSLQLVEVAPPYGGDFSNSEAVVSPHPSDPMNPTVGIAEVGIWTDDPSGMSPPTLTSPDSAWHGLVRINDLIRFNRQGHYYRIIGPPDASDPELVDQTSTFFEIQSVDSARPNYGSWLPVAYEVLRQPETSAGTPLELPDGIVIDLSLSGIGKAGHLPGYDPTVLPYANSAGPIALMFTPNGQAAVWAPDDPTGGFALQTIPFDSVFLMIGKNDAIWGGGLALGGPNDHATCNTSLTNSYWVTVHHQTGLVTSAENVANPICDLASARQKSIQTVVAGGK